MKEKVLIRYIRKEKTVMAPVLLENFIDPGHVVGGQDLVNNVERSLGRVYTKQKVSYPRGVLVCVCRGGHLYFGWSYISSMEREGDIVVPVSGEPIISNVPPFVKKIAVKIAMDKVNSRKKNWTMDDMPNAVRAKYGSFLARAKKYFKTTSIGNIVAYEGGYNVRKSADTFAG